MSGMRIPIPIILVPVLCADTLGNNAAAHKRELKLRVPPGRVDEESTSSLRGPQEQLRAAAADLEVASLRRYYIGQGQGGAVTANVDRWLAQMKQPDGSPVKGAKDEHLEANGLKVTTVDLSGTYVAETAPGSGTFNNKPGY